MGRDGGSSVGGEAIMLGAVAGVGEEERSQDGAGALVKLGWKRQQ